MKSECPKSFPRAFGVEIREKITRFFPQQGNSFSPEGSSPFLSFCSKYHRRDSKRMSRKRMVWQWA
jgi:hypothetical protein